MVIPSDISLELMTNKLIIAPGEEGEAVMLYFDYPALKKAARRIVSIVAEEYEDRLFSDFCAQCGRCCLERPVKAGAGELERIRSFLGGEPYDDFRARYIDSACTWNSGDGFIKKKEGRCIFLETLSPQRTSCRIHSVRPAACAGIAPSLINCRKARHILISQVKSITVSKDDFEIITNSAARLKLPIGQSALEQCIIELRSLLATLEKKKADRDEELLQMLCDRVESQRKRLISDGITADFYSEMISLNALTRSLDIEVMEKKGIYQVLVEKTRRLQGLTLALTGEPEPEACHDGTVITGLSIRSDELKASFIREGAEQIQCIRYESHAAVLESVRVLLKHLLSYGDPQMWEMLWHPESHCFLCGKCCQCMRVEITPADIERIALHFGLTEEEARKRYIFPPIFSWNGADGILAKKDREQLDRVATGADCIFLVRHSPSVALCSIYEARPDVCSGFDPTNRPCIEMSVVLKKDTFLENIITVEISQMLLTLNTVLSRCLSREPYVLHLKEDGDLFTICRELEKRAAEVILSCYRGTR
jgi:Fe-S-cluster containining protein